MSPNSLASSTHVGECPSEETPRNAIFISHANPEDNAFTIWLGARLSAAGYEVWADVLRLRGGQDWQRRLEHALRSKAFKVLLVGTDHGVQKQGVRNEIQIEHHVGRRIHDADFIIPLRLADFEAPFLVAHAQFIDFKRSWADGLAELLETLDQTYHVPRDKTVAAERMDYWTHVHLRHEQCIALQPEPLVSNWLALDEQLLPATYFYDFRGSISLATAQRRIRTAPWPIIPFRRGFLAFCPFHDLQDHFGPDLPLRVEGAIDTGTLLTDGWPDQRIERFDAHNQFGNLVRQAMELMLRRRSLASYEMASEQLAWWGAVGTVPSGKITFAWGNGLAGRRQIIGFSEKRRLYWHYGVTPRPRVFPFPHVRLASQVIFSEDGHSPIQNPKRMHRFRRSFTKSWRNARWRDMMLAFLHWLSEGEATLEVPVGSEVALSLALPPVTFRSPVSIILADDAEDEPATADDLAADDDDALVIDEFEDADEPEETRDLDDQDGSDANGR